MTKKVAKIIVPPDRPAFHLDKQLIEAAKRAKKAFDAEEKIMREHLMNQWIEEHLHASHK